MAVTPTNTSTCRCIATESLILTEYSSPVLSGLPTAATPGAVWSALGRQSAAGTGVSWRWTDIHAPVVQPLVAMVMSISVSLRCIGAA